MHNPVKRVAAIHDLSGFGRAALTSIIPVLSFMGIQVCPFPTAVLSTHTGDFEDFTFVDLTDSMEDYMNHWKKENIDFDCIYSGFLASTRQIDIISQFIDDFGNESNITVVDPVMGDKGELYTTMDKDMVQKMRGLITKADIITPNFTEAAYLLDRPVVDNIDQCKVKEWLMELSDMGPSIVVITSVPDEYELGNTDVMAYDRINNKFWKVGCKYIPANFPGTGDTFTSVLIGSLLTGDSLPIALDKSVQFITTAIRASYGFNYNKREGVLLERVLDTLKMPVILNSYELME
ncbi:pyridoxamine kinase [Clostridiisalibacter paucivorans]|uniref:pyridoxamine kinase n=1 Tax=Clostridiisalibacter paucivorans TaxID=408753 RepID=UPI00047DEA25|nr:pyridoxamine kinase [Clostridiisalibacter paucivorans]